ncbi:Beta,beta-carotene 9',10'-oxygenase [Chamberlinius hualienensis]
MDLKWALRSCEEDEASHHGHIQGNIPTWLRGGKILGIGAALFDIGDFKMNSLLDGYGMVIGITFDSETEVSIQGKYVQSDAYKKAMEASKPIYTEFASRGQADPSKNIVSRLLSTIKPNVSDNGNHSLCFFNKSVIAMTPTACYRHIDSSTLETKNKIDGSRNGVFMMSPHPQIDSDGSLYNIGIAFQPSVKYVVLKSELNTCTDEPDFSDTVILTSVSPTFKTKFSIVHSFSLTENYVIFVEHSSTASFMKMMKAIPSGKAFKDCIEWNPETLAKFFVVDKRSGKRIAVNYTTPGFLLVHHINAFEDGDYIIVDLITYANELFDDFSMDKLTSGNFNSTVESSQKRYVLPLPKSLENQSNENLITLSYTTATAKRQKDESIFCTPETLFDSMVYKTVFENPTINFKFNGRPYQYYYGVSGFFNGPSSYLHSIIKADVKSKHLTTFNVGEHYLGGNCHFIPAPDSKSEDDGVIVAIVNSLNSSHMDQLIVIDASSFTEIGRVELPIHVPAIAHLIFLPEYQFKN